MVIPEEEPIYKVQVRYAQGEIDTREYKKFLELYKKTRSYHQISSIKIILGRYASGEITFNEFDEILSHLFYDIIEYVRTEPIRIIQMRYVKGEINPQNYASLISTLQSDINTSEVTPVLFTLFMRLAKGELNLTQYEEIFSSLSVSGFHVSDEGYEREDVDAFSPPNENHGSSIPVSSLNSSLKARAASLIRDDYSEEIMSEAHHEMMDRIPVMPVADNYLSGASKSVNAENMRTTADLSATSNIPPHQPLFLQIKDQIKAGDYKDAILRLNEFLVGDPDNSKALFFKGIALFKQGYPDEALLSLDHAKKNCSHPDEEKEIDQIYSLILKKVGEKRSDEVMPEPLVSNEKPEAIVPPECQKPGYEGKLKQICDQVQSYIDSGDNTSALKILDGIDILVKEIPFEQIKEKKVDDLYAAKGFVLYQVKKYCEARKFFKESIRINPKNETAIHYLNDIRVRDCNKYVRHT